MAVLKYWDEVTQQYVSLAGQGLPGVGVPQGGSIGYLLSKASDNDYDTRWTPPPISYPVVLRQNRLSAQVVCGTGSTVILGTGTGGFGNIITPTNHWIEVVFSFQGYASGGSGGVPTVSMYQDGAEVAQIYQMPWNVGNNYWVQGTRMYLMLGDGGSHYWQAMGKITASSFTVPNRGCSCTVKDLGPQITTELGDIIREREGLLKDNEG